MMYPVRIKVVYLQHLGRMSDLTTDVWLLHQPMALLMWVDTVQLDFPVVTAHRLLPLKLTPLLFVYY